MAAGDGDDLEDQLIHHLIQGARSQQGFHGDAADAHRLAGRRFDQAHIDHVVRGKLALHLIAR
ncbi:hypothetical protein D3C72_1874210 [compost metagenome]